jgi:uncharacterized repeat protein (TIGR04076 family)
LETRRIPVEQQVIFAIILLVALPVANFHFEHHLYAQAVIALTAFAVGVVLLAAEWRRRPVAVTGPAIESVDRVLPPLRPATLRVLNARGVCPAGFQQGHTWRVDAEGHLTPDLCQGAIQQICPLLQLRGSELGFEQQVTCRCPQKGRELVFGVRLAPQPA